MDKEQILVVDDEQVIRESLKRILERAGYQVAVSGSGYNAMELVQKQDIDLVLTDLKMPGMEGLEVLKSIKVLQPDVPVVIITGYATVETAVEAIKSGAYDYLSKPFTPDQVKDLVSKALETRATSPENQRLQQELEEHEGFSFFIGKSKPMQKVYQRILKVAQTDSSVLITGESGTGKELVARAIHQRSDRHDHPFVPVDCTALAESLLESELFGHEKGSFTGAVQSKVGLFKVADGGTLFLDEVSNISLNSQAKLLRVLQEREVTPIGGTKAQPIDIRLIAATNRSLKDLVKAGKFREDLYFRINTIPIDLPPLREREGDLPLLISYFLRQYAQETGKDIHGLGAGAMTLLERYHWPGNVRELEHMIERAVVLCQGNEIKAEDLELPLDENHAEEGAAAANAAAPQTSEELKEAKRRVKEEAVRPLEESFAIDALKRNDWNITKAAQDVGMQRPNFQALLKKLDISMRERSNGYS